MLLSLWCLMAVLASTTTKSRITPREALTHSCEQPSVNYRFPITGDWRSALFQSDAVKTTN